jgi:hypothetical protein
MTRPLTQIDDEIREMTEDEYSQYLLAIEINKEGPNDLAG